MKKNIVHIIVLMGIALPLMGQSKNKEEIRFKVPELLQKLETAGRERKWHVIYDLGYSGDPRAVEPLCKITTDANENIWYRRIAAYALGLSGHTNAIPYLKDNLSSQDEELVVNSAGALLLLGENSIAYPILEDSIDKGNAKALEYLVVRENGEVVRIRDLRAKKILNKSITNAVGKIILNAAILLVKSKSLEGSNEVFYDLGENILRNSSDIGDVGKAIYLLKNVGDEKSKKILQHALNLRKEKTIKSEINNALKEYPSTR